jgi:hypothetical protein
VSATKDKKGICPSCGADHADLEKKGWFFTGTPCDRTYAPTAKASGADPRDYEYGASATL